MTESPRDDVVAQQYEKWTYPEPIQNLETWAANNWQWFDPSHAHRVLWPGRPLQADIDILIAGCGTNQAAVIAYTNPSAQVVAIDVSKASLDHHRWLKDRYTLSNLELHQLPIEQVASLDHHFDLVVTTGVLHHMRALAECLRPEGVLALMLYATYGRIGVQLMQSVFADMGLGQDEASLAVVRDALAQLSPMHPLASYLQIAPDLGDDAGVVDTFLHGREQAYTIDECRTLVEAAGLTFQDVFLKASYYAPTTSSNSFFSAVAAVPREQQWSVMQRINASNACHYFLACRPDREPASYSIDFGVGDPLVYVPAFRKGCGLRGGVIHRHDWQRELTPLQAALVEHVDGNRTISDIVDTVTGSGAFARADRAEVVAVSLETFQPLWQQDYLAMGIDI